MHVAEHFTVRLQFKAVVSSCLASYIDEWLVCRPLGFREAIFALLLEVKYISLNIFCIYENSLSE